MLLLLLLGSREFWLGFLTSTENTKKKKQKNILTALSAG